MRLADVLPKTPWGFALAQIGLTALVFIAISTLRLSRGCGRYGPEAAAVGSLRTITTAQSVFRETDRDGDGLLQYGWLRDLGRHGLIDEETASGVKQGYRFTVIRGSKGYEDSEYLWWAAADPVNPREIGARHFYTNQGGVIYFSDEGPIRSGSQDNWPDRGQPLGGR